MDETLLQFILSTQDVEYAVFDAGLQLKEFSAGLAQTLDGSETLQENGAITDIFSELVGYEQILAAIQNENKPPLRLERISHALPPDQPAEYWPRFQNLDVYPYQGGLLVVVRNVSGEGRMVQPIIQRRNELDLLNTRLLNDLQLAHDDLKQSYETTIEGWARALEMRDVETQGHSLRVSELTLKLAWEMGVTSELLPSFRRGALLHDIGKMGIPDRILLKNASLDEDEWVIMRQHPLYALQMLASISYLSDALDIPTYHHERWNGGGYPYHLAEEKIPLAARIFAVVDVYDALTHDRPYRPAWNEKNVMEYLERKSGILFDPGVMGVFLQLLKNSKNRPGV